MLLALALEVRGCWVPDSPNRLLRIAGGARVCVCVCGTRQCELPFTLRPLTHQAPDLMQNEWVYLMVRRSSMATPATRTAPTTVCLPVLVGTIWCQQKCPQSKNCYPQRAGWSPRNPTTRKSAYGLRSRSTGPPPSAILPGFCSPQHPEIVKDFHC